MFSGKFGSVVVVFVCGFVLMCFGEFMSMGHIFSVCSVCVFDLCVMDDMDRCIEFVRLSLEIDLPYL